MTKLRKKNIKDLNNYKDQIPKKHNIIINQNLKPIAIILAGYNKVDIETKRKELREIQEAYDDDIIYMGTNKFLHNLARKPVIQYVIDAVFNARNANKRIYDKIYVYNDIKSLEKAIDLSQYPNVIIKQMKVMAWIGYGYLMMSLYLLTCIYVKKPECPVLCTGMNGQIWDLGA